LDTTLIKGLRILERVIQSDVSVGVSALASAMKLPKSNVHRTLTTLVESGYLVQDESGNYRPTLRVWEQGARVIARDPLRRAALAFMQSLHQETAETVNLIVLDGDDCLYIHQISAPMPIRASSAVGHRAPAIYPASGKALLAFGPDPEKRVRAIFAKQKAPKPTVKLATLLDEISTIRKKGVAFSISGWREGINSVAGVIIGPNGLPAGAIALSGPQERMSDERMNQLAQSVLNACTHASSAFGA
jgi:IclR family transcriptional regulator, KDG regulon repressor